MPILGGLADVKDLNATGIPSEHEFVGRYADASGHVNVAADLDYYYAFCSFRMGSILAGVYARAVAGNASSGDALQAGKLGEVIAGLGVKHANTYQSGAGRLSGLAGAGSARAFSTAASHPVPLKERVRDFLEEHVIPIETEVLHQGYFDHENKWKENTKLDGLKAKAKEVSQRNAVRTKDYL